MANPARRAAVDILRQGLLGRAVEAYTWTGAPSQDDTYFNNRRVIRKILPPTSTGISGSGLAR
ncbi:MAG: hypothetical protein U1F77_12225 [Kiritimatiellia bacterium]